MQIIELNATRSEFANLARANRGIGNHNEDNVGLGRYSGQSPWERHTNGDELLYVVDGEVEIEALDGDANFRGTLRAGSLFVVPKGVWHRLTAQPSVTILFVSPPEAGAERTREDPRASLAGHARVP